jgi:diaminohydroxyphosphoribosylaminopyrimidine deaminase/5-amino-6-(5-phosphoribosylamino)uracil reductase
LIGGKFAKTPIGGEGKFAMKDAILLKNIEVTRFHNDIMVEGYLDI